MELSNISIAKLFLISQIIILASWVVIMFYNVKNFKSSENYRSPGKFLLFSMLCSIFILVIITIMLHNFEVDFIIQQFEIKHMLSEIKNKITENFPQDLYTEKKSKIDASVREGSGFLQIIQYFKVTLPLDFILYFNYFNTGVYLLNYLVNIFTLGVIITKVIPFGFGIFGFVIVYPCLTFMDTHTAEISFFMAFSIFTTAIVKIFF